MNRRLLLLVMLAPVVVASLAIMFSEDTRSARAQRLLLTGSSTVAPLATAIAKRYEAAHPGLRIDVETGGSSRGTADAMRGTADIGMASRKLMPSETGLEAHILARDGLAMIVHASNPLSDMSRDQVVALYTRHVTDWQSFGGRPGSVVLVHKAEGRGTLEVFLHSFGLENGSIRPDVIVGENAQAIKTVAANPDAIGYVSIGAAEAAVTEGVPIKLLALDGVPATTEALGSGVYGLARDLILVARPGPPAKVRDFLAFATSPAVDDLIRSNFFVPPAR